MKADLARAIWTDPAVVDWTGFLLNSYRRWFRRELIKRQSPQADSSRLYVTARVVVAQDAQTPAVFCYANDAAQQLWQMDWFRFLATPAEQSAEPAARAEREHILAEVAAKGYVSGYRGIRVTSTGQRFQIRDAEIWSVRNSLDQPIGMVAMFCRYKFV